MTSQGVKTHCLACMVKAVIFMLVGEFMSVGELQSNVGFPHYSKKVPK